MRESGTQNRWGDATRVQLFVTCVGELVEPDVPAATVRVLRAAGCTVAVPDGQTCCGQPAWNAGFVDDAARVAAATLDALEGDDAPVVVPAGSCTTMMRVYWPQLFELAGDPARADSARRLAERVVEFTEFLDDRDLPELHALDETVAVHRSCHMLRELHLRDAPDRAVDRVPGCQRADWSADDRCCGFGGTFAVKLPETSVAMADEKLDTLPDGVVRIVGADASCLLQMRTRAAARGLPVTTTHTAELLAEALGEPE